MGSQIRQYVQLKCVDEKYLAINMLQRTYCIRTSSKVEFRGTSFVTTGVKHQQKLTRIQNMIREYV